MEMLKNRRLLTGSLITVFMILSAVLGPLLLKTSAYTININERLMGPSALHWFGTDTLGRDLCARVIHGAGISLAAAFTVGFITGTLGLLLGLAAGLNRFLDKILMRICDGVKAIPPVLLAVAMMSLLGADLWNVILCLSLAYTPNMARLVRGAALVVREEPYIEAMKALGAGRRRIILFHIVPNIMSPLIVQLSFVFASSIITEASLSFLGAGVPVPQPSWGSILSEARGVIYQARWMVIFPGMYTGLAVLGFNLLGDGLRDLLNPVKSN
ncbi:MAG: ABC transporter permease [Treponema sp.]|jgi:peptide/nickel transport system permease protein|nr:ABC transporter permease [Treponema sp.]